MKNRAMRRQQRKKFLKKSVNIAKMMFRGFQETAEEHRAWAEKWAKHNYQNRKPCSCCHCMNPRHNKFVKGEDKETLQERKQKLSEDFDRDTIDD